MRTFGTDGQTDRLTDGAGFIGPRSAGPINSVEKSNTIQNIQKIKKYILYKKLKTINSISLDYSNCLLLAIVLKSHY